MYPCMSEEVSVHLYAKGTPCSTTLFYLVSLVVNSNPAHAWMDDFIKDARHGTSDYPPTVYRKKLMLNLLAMDVNLLILLYAQNASLFMSIICPRHSSRSTGPQHLLLKVTKVTNITKQRYATVIKTANHLTREINVSL